MKKAIIVGASYRIGKELARVLLSRDYSWHYRKEIKPFGVVGG